MSGISGSPRGARLLLVVPSVTSFLTFLAEVAEGWARRGGVVAVAAGPELPGDVATRRGRGWPGCVERLTLPAFRAGSPLSLWRASRRLAALMRAWRPDVVHAHFAPAVCATALARTFGCSPRAASIGTFHGLHGSSGSSPSSCLVAAAERWSAGCMTEVGVLNAEDQAALATRVGVPVRVHGSFGVGCDLGQCDDKRFPSAVRERIRQEVGIRPGAFVLAFVGRQTEFKGFPVVVRAHRLLRDSGIPSILLVVGEPDVLHASGISAAEQRVVASDPGVIRTGWQWDVARWLAIADICVLPSVREGMPVSLMEALAMGVPVITSDSRGCRDVVRHGVDGFVLPAPTPEAVAADVRRLVDDRPLLDSMRGAARAGRHRFDRRCFVAEQMDLYTRLLQGRGGAADVPSSREVAVPPIRTVHTEQGS